MCYLLNDVCNYWKLTLDAKAKPRRVTVIELKRKTRSYSVPSVFIKILHTHTHTHTHTMLHSWRYIYTHTHTHTHTHMCVYMYQYACEYTQMREREWFLGFKEVSFNCGVWQFQNLQGRMAGWRNCSRVIVLSPFSILAFRWRTCALQPFQLCNSLSMLESSCGSKIWGRISILWLYNRILVCKSLNCDLHVSLT